MKFYSDINIDLVEDLLEAMETGDEGTAADLIERIVSLRESEVFLQINDLSVNIAQTLSEIGADSTIIQKAYDLSEVKERLDYVLSSTQESSDNVLNQVESISENLKGIKALTTNISLSKEKKEALLSLIETSEKSVSDIILSQSYQDLTGQVITKVLAALTILEDSLKKVIKKSSQDLEEIVSDKDTVALGPSVTNKEKTKAVNGQDEVDSLLEDLGI